MKLATIRSSAPDGELVIVARDLRTMTRVADIAPNLQVALDNWTRVRPLLEERYRRLTAGEDSKAEPFDQAAALSPLPRAYQWCDGGAYPSHRLRMVPGQPVPEWFAKEPSLYQGASDGFLTPTEDIPAVSESHDIDFEGELAVITDFVSLGTKTENAASHILLVLLVNDVSLRALQHEEFRRGFGFIHSKPASSFSPVAVTPDELGSAWRDTRLHLPLVCHVNDKLIGKPNAGTDMIHGFDGIISYSARTKSMAAGSIVGGGTVSVHDEAQGFACIAESRAFENTKFGAPRTPWMKRGDRIRIEMFDAEGKSIFGAIDQRVADSVRS